ncbi:RNA polymerase sigma factor, sigma-70 family [Flexibacter flexilis DSM 6793]|uniref:RNA polymerase sigma factor, sigma-70 family n=1 Tax=Flexibacter flexilis DSM 6793 TaxID=927664 RepID=A0A1I1DWU8_9BACT|nr:sigma-70 family RNA polymerase sigma factor [Flexibacter flexilis]SFB77053.1 RNA polymerase sigma factor, sigma-70 family [Flexibacter flexilis DSM 6793]
MEDGEILQRIKRGDESALDYLYRKHYKMMAKMILRNSGTEDEAKDIFQDALIVFWEKVISDKLVLTSKISTFLYSICQNLWRKELDRKSKLSAEQTDNIDDTDPDLQERIAIVNQCIAMLGDTCKRLLTHYYFDKLSMSDIAEKMGFANADTAKTKKYKCKQELDKKIKSLYKASDFLD